MPRSRHSNINHLPPPPPYSSTTTTSSAATGGGAAAAASFSSSSAASTPIHVNSGGAADSSHHHLHLQQLPADYLRLFSSSTFSDVVFVVDGRPVPAHRCVLAARSSFFESFFRASAADDLAAAAVAPLHVPVDVVGYDAFLIVLRFLYSGRLILERSGSGGDDRNSSSAFRRSSVGLALEALNAATFFGIQQLSALIQAHLEAAVTDGFIAVDGDDDDEFIQILSAANTHRLNRFFRACALAIPASADLLRRRLPPDIAAEIDGIRASAQLPVGFRDKAELPPAPNCMSEDPPQSSDSTRSRSIRRMRQALDSMDMELLRMIVLGEGLDLDDARALHYAVTNCGRQAAKALLEMGAVDVNHAAAATAGGRRRTALQLACEMADPDLISLLLNHNASPSIPNAATPDNPLNIIRAHIIATADRSSCSASSGGGGSSSSAEASETDSRLRLCLELLQSAALVEEREGYGKAAAAERASVDGQQYSSERGGGGGGAAGSAVESCSCSSTPHSALQPNHGLPALDLVGPASSPRFDAVEQPYHHVRVHTGQQHDDHHLNRPTFLDVRFHTGQNHLNHPTTLLEEAGGTYNHHHNPLFTTFFPIHSPFTTPDTTTIVDDDNNDNDDDDDDDDLDAFQELDQSPLLLLPTHPLDNPTPPCQLLSGFTNFPYYAHPDLAQPQGTNPFSYHHHATSSGGAIPNHFSLYFTTSTP